MNLLSIAVCAPGMLAGCGPRHPETVPVRGIATLDGKPLGGASVLLTPRDGGRPAHGITDESGRFALTTFEPGDGALLGNHTVIVTLQEMSGVVDGNGLEGIAPGGIKVQWIVPEKYSKPETSGLNVEVKRGMGPIRLELKSGSSARRASRVGYSRWQRRRRVLGRQPITSARSL